VTAPHSKVVTHSAAAAASARGGKEEEEEEEKKEKKQGCQVDHKKEVTIFCFTKIYLRHGFQNFIYM
jgi:hypothetical protein